MTVLSTPRTEPVWAAQGWEVLTVGTPGGFVETRVQGAGLTLALGDRDAEGARSRALGSTCAWFGPGGRAWVECVSAPPGLWLGAHGRRLAPAQPSRREDLRLSPGDLLVLCSADVLEHLDHGLPQLTALTEGLGDPAARARALAADLTSASPAGAAAIAVWTATVPAPPATTRTRSTDTEEVRP